jgi:transcriptional/translational regulatory protein YebC/TACO1
MEENATLITAKGYDLEALVEAVRSDESLSITLQESGWFALDEITLDEASNQTFQKLLGMLDSVDDVSNVYHNVAEDKA